MQRLRFIFVALAGLAGISPGGCAGAVSGTPDAGAASDAGSQFDSPVLVDTTDDASSTEGQSDADVPAYPPGFVPCAIGTFPETCNVFRHQICCWIESHDNGICVWAGGCQQFRLSASCDGPEDCPPDQVCCNGPLTTPTDPFFVSTRCRPIAECVAEFSNRIACHASSECPSAQPYCCAPTLPPLNHSDQHVCSAVDCSRCAGQPCPYSVCCPQTGACVYEQVLTTDCRAAGP